jgi:hypothetical protein
VIVENGSHIGRSLPSSEVKKRWGGDSRIGFGTSPTAREHEITGYPRQKNTLGSLLKEGAVSFPLIKIIAG